MLKETTYSMNDIYLFLKDKWGFPAMADTWKKMYGHYTTVTQSDVRGWLSHQLPGDVAEYYFRQLQASVTGIMAESDTDLNDIAVQIVDVLDSEGIDLIQDYALEIDGHVLNLVDVDLNKRIARSLVLEILNNHFKTK